MKRKIKLIEGIMLKAVILTLVSSFCIPELYAVIVLPDVKVNTQSYVKINMDGGGKQLSVLKDTVFVIWQGQPTKTSTNIYFTKSIDKGATFGVEKSIFELSDSIDYWFPTMSTSQNGDIHVAVNEVTNNEVDYNILYAKSVDGGKTFPIHRKITTNKLSAFPCIGSFGNNVYIFYAQVLKYPKLDYYFVRSTDNGNSFGSPIKINDAECQSDSMEFDGITSMFVDKTGKIYLAWVDGRRSTGKGDIFLAKSVDNGITFSPNIMVNDINQQGADSAQYLPSVVADGLGNVYVSFTDKRLGKDWSNNRAYFSRSYDSGSTFVTEKYLGGEHGVTKHHNIAVNSLGLFYAALCVNVSPLWGTWIFESEDKGNSFSIGVSLCSVMNADYSDLKIIAGEDDEIYSIWKDSREGNDINNVYFARTNNATGFSKVDNNSEIIIYQNPSSGSVLLKLPGVNKNVEVTVYSLNGQVVYRKTEANTSELSLDLKMPTGIYFVNVNSNNEEKTLKLIYKREF